MHGPLAQMCNGVGPPAGPDSAWVRVAGQPQGTLDAPRSVLPVEASGSGALGLQGFRGETVSSKGSQAVRWVLHLSRRRRA